MPVDLSETLVVGISATALFDLAEANQLFREKVDSNSESAVEAYRQYMLEREDEYLNPGTGYPLVCALLNLNEYTPEGESPIVEVVVMSRNSPETGLRVLKTIRNDDLKISRSAFTAGESVTDYLDAFGVDLFLTTDHKDAQLVIDSGICAAAVMYPPPKNAVLPPENQVRIAFDGDAVLFGEESEVVYKTKGLDSFHKAEDAAQNIPLADGPHASLLKKLGMLQDRLPMRVEHSPVRIALVTARNSPAEMRVIYTLRGWGVYVDEAFFLGGIGKQKVLQAFKPHIFFDDQALHLESASKFVSSAHVPYRSDSPLLQDLQQASSQESKNYSVQEEPSLQQN